MNAVIIASEPFFVICFIMASPGKVISVLRACLSFIWQLQNRNFAFSGTVLYVSIVSFQRGVQLERVFDHPFYDEMFASHSDILLTVSCTNIGWKNHRQMNYVRVIGQILCNITWRGTFCRVSKLWDGCENQ